MAEEKLKFWHFVRAYLITVVTWLLVMFVMYIGALVFTDSNEDGSLGYGMGVALFLVPGVLAWFNLLFIIFLYFTKIDRSVLTTSRWCIVECILYLVMYYVIDFIINRIPQDICYGNFSEVMPDGRTINWYGQKWWCTAEAQLIYTYITLTIIYLIKKVFVIKKNRLSKSK